MSVTIELLDRLKASRGGVSDYRAAKILGVSQPTVSSWRTGVKSLSAEKVILICEILREPLAPWLLRWQIERAKCDKERQAWEAVAERLAA